MNQNLSRCLDWVLLRPPGYLNHPPATSLEILRPRVSGALIRVFVETDQNTPSASSFGQHVPVGRALGKLFSDGRVVGAYAGKAGAFQDFAYAGCDIGVEKQAVKSRRPS